MALLNLAKAVSAGPNSASRVYRGDLMVWPPNPNAPARPTGSNASDTGGRLTWTAVPDITEYEVKHQSKSYGIAAGNTRDISDLTKSSTYDFQVRAVKRYGADHIVYSEWSPILRLATGRPEVRKTGSGTWEGRPTNSGTYRPPDGWTYNGKNVAQGYYSNSSYTAYGHWTYDGAGFRNWVSTTWGSDVVSNLNFTYWRVALYRNSTSGTGDSGARTIQWYVSPGKAHVGSSTPSMAGGARNGTISRGTSGWFNAGGSNMHWVRHVLMNETLSVGTINSFAHYHAGSHDYMIFLGYDQTSNGGNLYCEFNWDFVTQSYIAPAWSSI